MSFTTYTVDIAGSFVIVHQRPAIFKRIKGAQGVLIQQACLFITIDCLFNSSFEAKHFLCKTQFKHRSGRNGFGQIAEGIKF